MKDDPDQFPPISTYAPDEDLMAVSAPKKNVKKKGSKPTADKTKPSQAGIDDLQGVADARWKAEAAERIRKIEDKEKTSPAGQAEFQATEMNKLKNWNFTAEKLDKVKKPGKFSKLLTYAAAGIGKILSLALQIVSLGHFWRAKSMPRFDFTITRKWQTSKDNQNVPGWDGAKFDPAASGSGGTFPENCYNNFINFRYFNKAQYTLNRINIYGDSGKMYSRQNKTQTKNAVNYPDNEIRNENEAEK